MREREGVELGLVMEYGASDLEKNFSEGVEKEREGGRVFKDLRWSYSRVWGRGQVPSQAALF